MEEIPGDVDDGVRHHKLNFMLPDTGDTGEASFTGAKVENVTFAYEVNGFEVDRENDLNHKVSETKTDTILDHYTLTLQSGQITGIHGASGSGKSTLLKLLMRFWDVQEGSVSVDGADVREIPTKHLRDMESYVTQKTHLFHDSIANNIAIAKPGATREEIMEAAKKASIHDFIMTLPKGYDTMLTGDGANLSQGQRQLLAIARAAIADPPVLILDEATSSIDTRTERIVQDGMDKLMRGRTTFVIAHRLSTVRNSDCIMVLEQGRIIERGTHDELIEEKGRYYQLYTGNAISA